MLALSESLPDKKGENVWIQQGEVTKARLAEKKPGLILETVDSSAIALTGLDENGQTAVKQCSAGLKLAVPENSTFTLDIYCILNESTNAVNAISIGAGAIVKLMFHFEGAGNWNAVTFLSVAKDAVVELQEESTGGDVTHTVQATLDSNAKIDIAGVLLNSGLWKREVALAGDNAQLRDNTVFFISGEEKIEVITDVEQVAPDTKASVHVQGLCKDKARSRSQGLMKIRKSAVKADSFLSQHTLLLDKSAKADCIPDLEIEINDVKAGHSASVSPVSPEHIFYLMSRGMSRDEARKLVALGYLEPAIEKLSNAEQVRELVRRKWDG